MPETLALSLQSNWDKSKKQIMSIPIHRTKVIEVAILFSKYQIHTIQMYRRGFNFFTYKDDASDRVSRFSLVLEKGWPRFQMHIFSWNTAKFLDIQCSSLEQIE